MKNLCLRALALPVTASLVFSSLPLRAQLAASGTAGDRVVYTLGAGATLGTGVGTRVLHPFDTVAVEDDADSFDLKLNFATPGQPDPRGTVSLTAGHHLVIYGTRYINGAGGARAGLDNTIVLGPEGDGDEIPYGAASSYSRDGSNNNHFVRGGTIIEAAQGDVLNIRSTRVDNHPQTIIQQDADLQLIKLDDSLSFLRLSASGNVPNLMSNSSAGPAAISYDVQDEVDSGFTHAAGSSEITLEEAGSYLVFANSGFRISGGNRHRQAITQRLTLDGNPVEDTSTVVFVRYSASGDGLGGLMVTGAASLGTIIETSAANTVLEVEVERDNNPATTNTAVALEASLTGLTILKLPGYGEYLRLSGPSQEISAAQGNPETPLALSEVSPVSNASFSYDAGTSSSQVIVNKDGDYLFLASHYLDDFDTPPGEARTITRQGFQTIPNGGTAGKISYGHGGAYNRDRTAGNGGDRARDSGDWAGAILPLAAGDAVETTTSRFGLSNSLIANSVGLQALNIGSISSAPSEPVVEVNLPLNQVVNSTSTITSASNLRTSHISDGAAALVYTVDTAPAGGTLSLSGTALAAGDTFTQADVDTDLLTFAAGATAATGGFDFTVRDSAGNAVSGSFVINVGASTALVADAASTDENTITTEADLAPAAANLLANDNGSALSVTSHDATSAQGAAVTVNTDGTFTYNPTASTTLQALDEGDQLADTFDYTVTDIFNQQSTTTVTITVNGVNDNPVASDDAFANGERSVTTGDLLANDVDVDTNDNLTVTSVAGGATGTIITAKGALLTVNPDGSMSYDPSTSVTLSGLTTGASDSETIAYEISDGTATASASVTFTTLGEGGSSPDFATVDASGANSSATIDVLANDTVGGAPGTATAGAPFDLNAGDLAANNNDSTWNNSNVVSGKAVSMTNSVLRGVSDPNTGVVANPVVNAPPGITRAYYLSGNGSGGLLGDADTTSAANHLYGSNFSASSFSVEAVIRPDDQVGPEPIWGTGGNGVGSSLILIDDQLIFTIGQSAQVAQAIAAIPPNAVENGDYVHVLGTFNIGSDEISLYINGNLVDTSGAVNVQTGGAGNVTDWSGADDEGLGRSQGTTGGDISVPPFLGSYGTTDIPDFNEANDRFDGEISIMRVYSTALTQAEVNANVDAVFGVPSAAAVGNIIELAGQSALVPGTTVITLDSGATVALEADGSLTYDANGAFADLGIGLTVSDSFTYTLDSALNAVNTVTVTVNGTNTDPQIEIAADQNSVTEGEDAGFTITSSLALTTAVDVTLSFGGNAQQGDDFTGSTVVTLPAGGTPFALDLPTIADALFEGAENLTVTIDSVTGSAVVGQATEASVTIADSDNAPSFTIGTPAGASTEGSAIDFTVVASVASDAAVTLDFVFSGAAGPEDFCPNPGSLTIPAGQTSVTVSLLALDDAVAEGNENLIASIASPSVGSLGAPASATTTITDGSGIVLFDADFEGINPAETPGGTLLNADAPAAANLGTTVGEWANIFTTTVQGSAPGVFPEGGADVKGDGIDNALRLDRPGPGDGLVCAQFDGAIDISGSNTGVITFDLASRRTQNLSTDKDTRIVGLDEAGNKSFELVVNTNNSGASHEQLFHVNSAGTQTPVGNIEDFNNSGNFNEDRMSNVRIILTSTGYCVQVERFPLGNTPAPDTATAELPYAGNATSVSQLIFEVSGSNDTGINGGIYIDDIRATGAGLSTVQAWRVAYFGSSANSGDGADNNDFNNNGLDNLLDFAFGIDPVAGAAVPDLEVDASGNITQFGGITIFQDPSDGRVYLRYPRRTDFDDVGLAFDEEFSRDLTAFEDAASAPSVIGSGISPAGTHVEAMQIEFPSVLPVSGGKARYARVRVNVSP